MSDKRSKKFKEELPSLKQVRAKKNSLKDAIENMKSNGKKSQTQIILNDIKDLIIQAKSGEKALANTQIVKLLKKEIGLHITTASLANYMEAECGIPKRKRGTKKVLENLPKEVKKSTLKEITRQTNTATANEEDLI